MSSTKYPSFVSFVTPTKKLPFCGGTILDETTILTAAHCSLSSKNEVLYGTNKRSSKSTAKNLIGIKSVKSIGTALGSKGGLYKNDYAIVKLVQPIPLGRTAQKVELGTFQEFNDILMKKKKCTVVGQGNTDIDGQWSDVLKEGTVGVAAHDKPPLPVRCSDFKADPKNCILFKNTDKTMSGRGDS
ncbi:Oidioi.mRNA.OKI2018_I69.chr1.g1023.t1.cds [Oikopleura dioica]|uniref:Oidioi.mRNA.OKI2018_I69.chr1.g1023.t1.cds n=1 Tax=Oikopleura dioica TaxID=34765 RepID=A0ABN7SVW1_OIKDI|nr:Oidioi.mRNA.OKI2018_I69.chr1.g1023.t1.cds [Oikopleura dioica]